jgi:hypothetical protein
MNLTAVSAAATVSTTLRVVKDNKAYLQQTEQLAALAWQIAYTALWNGTEFSAKEISETKTFILQFIRNGSPLKTYSELVQRVLLARQYILTHPGTYAPCPGRWFSPENSRGFAGTQRWYQKLTETRTRMPKHQLHLKAFAEAVLETMQSNKAADFHYWRSWFAERGAQATLNLFLSVLANGHYQR